MKVQYIESMIIKTFNYLTNLLFGTMSCFHPQMYRYNEKLGCASNQINFFST